MLSTEIFLWYLNYRAWCDEYEIDPCSYADWLIKPFGQKLLWSEGN